jgi:hypothetical protein
MRVNPQKDRGDRAEREVQTILQDLLGIPARRKLGAGRQDDTGDIDGLPSTVIQVANWADLNRAVREKLPATVQQQHRAAAAYGALWCRRRGGQYVVILTPEQWCDLWREAAA